MNGAERRERTVERQARADSVVIRHPRDNFRGSKRRNSWASISLRVPFRWTGALRHWYHSGRGQKMKKIIQDHAYANALTALLITILFAITWLWIFISVAFFGGSLSG